MLLQWGWDPGIYLSEWSAGEVLEELTFLQWGWGPGSYLSRAALGSSPDVLRLRHLGHTGRLLYLPGWLPGGRWTFYRLLLGRRRSSWRSKFP